MASPVTDKHAYILIALEEPETADRLRTALEGSGYVNISVVDTPLDAATKAQVQQTDWIIVETFKHLAYNASDLMDDINERRMLNHVFCSVVVSDDTDYNILPYLFEKGMFCYFDKSQLAEDVAQLDSTSKKEQYKNSLISAAYFRKMLFKKRKKKLIKSLLALEEELHIHIHNQPHMMLHFAGSLTTVKRFEDAKMLCVLAAYLDSKLKPKSEEMIKEIEKKLSRKEQLANASDLSAVVVDPDTSVCAMLEGILRKYGFYNVSCFDDTSKAWDWLQKNPEPTVIITEWHMPGLDGGEFIQRIRGLGMHKAAIIIASSRLKKSDAPILTEMNVASVMTKPLRKEEFNIGLQWIMQQEKFPTEQKYIEKAVLEQLSKGNLETAKVLRAAYFANSKIGSTKKLLMYARFLYHQGEHARAKEIITTSSQLAEKEALSSVTLLAKCFHSLGQSGVAIRCLEKAQRLSPKNVMRLCQIAMMQLEESHDQHAEATLGYAKRIDAEHPEIAFAALKVHFVRNQIEEAQEKIPKLHDLKSAIAYMNNHSVEAVLNGKVQEGVVYYKNALKLIPGHEEGYRSIVNYNLGLAYARISSLELSRYALEDALEVPNPVILERAESLLRRVKVSIEKETPLKLNLEDEEDTILQLDMDHEPVRKKEESVGNQPLFPKVKCLSGIISLPKSEDDAVKKYFTKTASNSKAAA